MKKRNTGVLHSNTFSTCFKRGVNIACLGLATLTSLAVNSQQLEEIVVTAEFRETNVQDTPIAITAVSAEMMEARSQTNIYEVASQSPNVTLKPAGQARSGMVAFIRGVGQDDFVAAMEPGVGIYVDDVYYSTLTGSLLDLLDLQRVEILRGPQGTLAGKNSIGGAVKLYSKKPGSGGSNLQVTYGSLNRIEARGAADFELSDNVFMRVSGASRERDGYVDVLDYACTHPGSGLPTLRTSDGCKVGEMGDQAYVSGRASLLWQINDDVELTITGDVVNDNSGTAAGVLLYGDRSTIEAGGGVPVITMDDGDPMTPPVMYHNHIFVPYGPNHNPNDPVRDPYVNYATFLDNTTVQEQLPGSTQPVPWKPAQLPSANTLDMQGLSAKLDWQLGENLSLTSITAYRTYESFFNQDSDLSPLSVTLVGNRVEHDQISEEIRLNGMIGDAIDWTVGGFYFDQDNWYEGRIDLPYAFLDFIHGPDPTPSTTWAVFTNWSFNLTDSLNISAGLRYSDEEKEYTHHRSNPDGTAIAGPTPASPNYRIFGLDGITATFEDDRVDWRLAVNYRFADSVMLYGQASTGYKGGGVNPRPYFDIQVETFEPETLTSLEFGIKSELLDSTMRLNGAIFFNEYEDIQLVLNECQRPSPPFPTTFGAPCQLPSNVGSADVQGLELEMEYYPTDGLAIDFSYSYIDFEYTEINGSALLGSPIAPLDMVTPYTPEDKWSVGVQYRFVDGDSGTITGRIDASYQSDIYANATNNATNLIDSYTLTNARLWWEAPEQDWQITLEVTKLADELYYLSIYDQANNVGQVTGQPGMPRQWALSIRKTFD